MNIGIFSLGSGYKDASGTGTFLLQMMRHLSEDHQIHFITSGSGPLRSELRDLNVTVVQIPTIRKESHLNSIADRLGLKPAEIEMMSALPRSLALKSYVDQNVDVLSTHYYLDNLIVSNLVSVPTIFHFPGIKHPSIRWKTMARFANPDIYLSNSEATATRLYEWLDVEVAGTVYPGVDLRQFSPDAESAFNDDRVSILFVGRLDEGKGLFDLLESQSRLGDTTRLYLVGSGTLEGELRDSMRTFGIEDDVEFVGAVPHDKVHHYYAAADIFCLPSYHESFGMVNVEAMASGCPVVSTRIDAIEEYLNDGENGLLVTPGDVDELTGALDRLAADDELRSRLIKNGLERAVAFGWSEQASKMEKYYERAR